MTYTPFLHTTKDSRTNLGHNHQVTLDPCDTLAAAVAAREDYTRDNYGEGSYVYTKTKKEAIAFLRGVKHDTMIKL